MADLPVLDAEEQRVLGALLEKQRTVPASYPMTLGALRTACNQTSSRDPVVDYDEATVEAVVKRLRPRGPQAPGELMTRTERLHPFADRVEVEACLARMAARSEPLVRELARK